MTIRANLVAAYEQAEYDRARAHSRVRFLGKRLTREERRAADRRVLERIIAELRGEL